MYENTYDKLRKYDKYKKATVLLVWIFVYEVVALKRAIGNCTSLVEFRDPCHPYPDYYHWNQLHDTAQ